jgi:hypothetical protein
VGRWRCLTGLDTFLVRFKASYPGSAGELRLDVHSASRVLLVLILFSNVGEDDALTSGPVASHRVAARLLAQHGAEGAEFFAFAREMVPATHNLPIAVLTRAAGYVGLVHPFLVHGAQRHRGSRPRFLAQPPPEQGESGATKGSVQHG